MWGSFDMFSGSALNMGMSEICRKAYSTLTEQHGQLRGVAWLNPKSIHRISNKIFNERLEHVNSPNTIDNSAT